MDSRAQEFPSITLEFGLFYVNHYIFISLTFELFLSELFLSLKLIVRGVVIEASASVFSEKKNLKRIYSSPKKHLRIIRKGTRASSWLWVALELKSESP